MSTPSAPGLTPPAQGSDDSSNPSQTAYDDLRRLIPSLAAELDFLRASSREHNLWILRYGHTGEAPPPDPIAGPAAVAQETDLPTPPTPPPPPPPATESHPSDPELPAYSSSDVPPYGGVREEVTQRRDQLMEWLREGEDVLREYSARYAQLAGELQMPAEDVLGTWQEAAPDNALPDYETVEEREELMVGGVGEVPPPYIRGRSWGSAERASSSA